MKKFLAVFFALIFALSCAAPAFAAVDLACPYCGKSDFASEKVYNQHLGYDCPVRFEGNAPDPNATPCKYAKYGCTASFVNDDQYFIHITETCPFKKTTWGDEVANFFLELDYSDFKGVLDTITEALTGIGLPGIVNTIIGLLEDAVKGIIDAI